MTDAFFRFVYFWGHRAARIVWWITRPSVQGALIAVHHQGQVLFVRTSYTREWGFPGGGVAKAETPLEAAVRELAEEIGWSVEPQALHEAGRVELVWRSRRDLVTFFEARPADPPSLRLDNREIVEARFMIPEAALGERIEPHVRAYLEGRLDPPAG